MRRDSKKRGKLHPASFKQFIQETYRDPKRKAQVVAEIQSLGFSGYAEKRFDLISRQKIELETIQDADLQSVFTNAVVAAMQRNGMIELVHEGHDPANLRIEIYARKGEVGIRIIC